jgi:outer membrane protein assembly factor BamB
LNTTANEDALIWRMAGGDATRRGLFPRAVQVAARPSRPLPARGAVQASVVFDAEDRVFVADMAGNLQAFSPQGVMLWRTVLPGGVSGTPAVHPAQAQIYVGTHKGWACALHNATGSILWQKQLPTKTDPRILSDLLYLPQANAVILSSWGGRFHALDAATGSERFTWDAGLSPYSAAAASNDGSIYCLRAANNRGVEFVRVTSAGDERVLHQAPPDQRGVRRTMVAAAPVLDPERGIVYFVANHERASSLYAWSSRNNALLWEQPLPHAVQATPAVRKDGVVLIADLAGFVQAVGPDGAVQFRYPAECEYLLAGLVSEAGGTSFMGDPLGFLHAIDRLGAGKTIFETPRSVQARPAFDRHGSLYLPSTDHHVYVFPGTFASESALPE